MRQLGFIWFQMHGMPFYRDQGSSSGHKFVFEAKSSIGARMHDTRLRGTTAIWARFGDLQL